MIKNMAITKCPFCGEKIAPAIMVCPYCDSTLLNKKIDSKNKTTKDCPYCGEKILKIARKCRHCGEFLDSKDVSKDQEKENTKLKESYSSLWVVCLYSILGFVSFYYGGWNLVLGKVFYKSFDQLMAKYLSEYTGNNVFNDLIPQSDILIENKYLLLRINEGYYGFIRDITFFDSPVIQWVMLFFSIAFLYEAIISLITLVFEKKK